MEDGRIVRCQQRIAEEERLVREAPDEIAAELHVQKTRLYRTQLAVLQADWTGETQRRA